MTTPMTDEEIDALNLPNPKDTEMLKKLSEDDRIALREMHEETLANQEAMKESIKTRKVLSNDKYARHDNIDKVLDR